jgi:hypothetical protein
VAEVEDGETTNSEASDAEANSVRFIKWKGKKNIICFCIPQIFNDNTTVQGLYIMNPNHITAYNLSMSCTDLQDLKLCSLLKERMWYTKLFEHLRNVKMQNACYLDQNKSFAPP